MRMDLTRPKPERGTTNLRLTVLALVGLIASCAREVQEQKVTRDGDSLPRGAIARLDPQRWPHDQGVTFIARLGFSRDGKQIFTENQAAFISAWDTRTGKRLRSIEEPRGNLYEVSRERLLIFSVEGSFRLRDLATDKEMQSLTMNLSIGTVAVSQDNKLLAVSGTEDNKGVIAVYELATGKERCWFRLPDRTPPPPLPNAPSLANADPLDSSKMPPMPRALLFSPDGQTLAGYPFVGPLLDCNNKVALWSLTLGRELPTIHPPKGQEIGRVAFSPDGRSLAVELRMDFGEDTPRLYETATGLERRRYGTTSAAVAALERDEANMGAYPRLVADVAISPDGKILAHGRKDGTIALWDVAARQELGELTGHQSAVFVLSFSADGKMLASSSLDTMVLIWDITTFSAKAKPQAALVDVPARWQDLISADAAKAFDAICALAAAPDKAVPYLKGHSRPAVAADAATINRLIAELDSDRFDVREKANEELANLGETAVPQVRTALEANPSAEARKRLKALLAKAKSRLPTGETLRSLRAIEVLEMIGTAEAKSVLKDLARGTADAWVTRAAQAALERIGR
jgi:WD40 repeat protein